MDEFLLELFAYGRKDHCYGFAFAAMLPCCVLSYTVSPMKIHIDKSDTASKLGLSAARLRAILALVPAEWLVDVSEVRVSTSLVPANSRCRPGDASFNPYDQRLTIFARDHTAQQLVVPILTALAAHHLDFPRRRGSRLSAADAKKLAQIIAPHSESVVRCLTTRSGEQAPTGGSSLYLALDSVDACR